MLVDYDTRGVAEVMGLDASDSIHNFSPGFSEEAAPPFEYPVDLDDRGSGVRHADRGLSPVSIEKIVAAGLPRWVLRRVAERLAGPDKARVAALEWGIVPKTTLERRGTRLSPQESERTERVARLFVHARRALGTEDEARAFMMAPHPELDGRSPAEAARTDLGTRRAERVLNALEYGLAV